MTFRYSGYLVKKLCGRSFLLLFTINFTYISGQQLDDSSKLAQVQGQKQIQISRIQRAVLGEVTTINAVAKTKQLP